MYWWYKGTEFIFELNLIFLSWEYIICFVFLVELGKLEKVLETPAQVPTACLLSRPPLISLYFDWNTKLVFDFSDSKTEQAWAIDKMVVRAKRMYIVIMKLKWKLDRKQFLEVFLLSR